MTPLLLALLAAQPARPFPEERQLLDRRLETLRRILPDAPSPRADLASLREIADGLHLLAFDAVARPPAESGALGSVVVDVTGIARFADVDRFFRQVALHPRLVDVESLELVASNGALVRFAAAVAFAFRPSKAPLPPPPRAQRGFLNGVSRPQAEAYLRDEALVLAKSESIAGLRRSRRNPRLFLAELSAVARDRPVSFTHASLADEFVVRGLALGEAPSRELQSRFERGFFRVSDFMMIRSGACRRFEAKGRAPVAGPEAELPLPSEDPFLQDESACRPDRDSEPGPRLERAPPKGRPGQGPLTLRLRDVDLADVFHALHLATGVSFLVDGDVVGRASLDLIQATLDEVLNGLRRAGLRVSEAGTVRRVSRSAATRGGAAAPGESGATDAKASFALKRAEVRDLLAVMAEVDPALATLGPQGFLGRVSLWTKDVPVTELRTAVLEAAGLRERTENERRVVFRDAAPGDEVSPVAASPSERRLVLGPQDQDVRGFELSGLVSGGSGFTALAYSATGRLFAYRAGDRLADGSVSSVDAGEARLETEEGPLRVTLPPLPR